MAGDSDLEKTEQPTESKIKKAKEQGQIPRSRELTSMIILFVGFVVLWIIGATMSVNLTAIIQQGMLLAQRTDDDRQIVTHLVLMLKSGGWTMLPLLLWLIIAALIAPICIGGLLFNLSSLKPDFKRLNPIAGFSRIMGKRVFAELLKSLLKVILIASVTAWFLWIYFPNMLALPHMSFNRALSGAMKLLIWCGIWIVISLLPMVCFDIFYQIWSNLKKLKMSKQELKDEFKEQEGDPFIKGRIRQIQQAMARRNMMRDLVNANVIITNPTHYAIALQYDEKTMHAPKVIAKGVDHIALHIRELGHQYHIPQLEAPPLARALYRHSDIGETIPAELYAAVAQVLAWVYQLKRWRQLGGIAPDKPRHLPVPESFDPATNQGETKSNE